MSKIKSVEVAPVYDANNIPLDYIIVIDAGSKGTRAFLYSWGSPASATHEPIINLNSHWHKKVKPGVGQLICDYWNDSNNLDNYFDRLLSKIFNIIPREQHYRTPIFFHGTAGLRVLQPEVQTRVLNHVCTYLQTKTDFFLPDCQSHVNIIDGEIEALYSWTAVNYLKSQSMTFQETWGVLELGGGSTQIALGVDDQSMNNQNYFNLQLSRSYNVYTDSFAKYGFNNFHEVYLQYLLMESNDQSSINDPCLPKGSKRRVKINNIKHELIGLGDEVQCRTSINSIFQVKLLDSSKLILQDKKFLAVSGYWDTISQLLNVKGDDLVYDYKLIEEKTASVCKLTLNELAEGYPHLNENEYINLCFKSLYILQLLENGILEGGMEAETPEVLINDRINGFDFTWTLGRAILYSLDEFHITQKTDHRIGFNKHVSPRSFQFGSEQKGVERRPEFKLFDSYNTFKFSSDELTDNVKLRDSWWSSNSTGTLDDDNDDDDDVYEDHMDDVESVSMENVSSLAKFIMSLFVLLLISWLLRKWIMRMVYKVKCFLMTRWYKSVKTPEGGLLNIDDENMDENVTGYDNKFGESYELDNIIRASGGRIDELNGSHHLMGNGGDDDQEDDGQGEEQEEEEGEEEEEEESQTGIVSDIEDDGCDSDGIERVV